VPNDRLETNRQNSLLFGAYILLVERDKQAGSDGVGSQAFLRMWHSVRELSPETVRGDTRF